MRLEKIDIDYLSTWVGHTRSDVDAINLRHALLLAATVDYPKTDSLRVGQALPPLWHWIYFLEGQATSQLGADGHPSRGGFLPPIPLPNRMWAGGRVTFLSPLLIGSTVRKTSRIVKIVHKQGRSGDLLFVTVLHELHSLEDKLLLSEEQDLVYKGSNPAPQVAAPSLPPVMGQFSRTFTPTASHLFRYSALTFNGHRIHYDVDYCREVEGYRNLVIHGPLNATMLANHAEEITGKRLRSFTYRGLAPALLGNCITLRATGNNDSMKLTATLDTNVDCMQAEALFA